MIRVTDKFIAPSRGTVEDVFAFWETNPPARRQDAEKLIQRVYDLCMASDIDFSLAVSRIADETGSLNGPSFLVSDIWRERLNPGGIGVTDGEDKMISFDTGTEAANSYMAHMFSYILGSAFNVDGVTPDDDPRWDAIADDHPEWFGSVRTLDDLRGRWFTNPQGAINSAARGNHIFPNLPDQSPTPTTPAPTPGGSTGMSVTIGNRPLRIAVGAGHHDTARGNYYETELNGRKANALIRELRARGHDVYSTHPNDGLGYASTDYNGVAKALVAHVNATGWKPDYHIECHSEGSAASKCGSFILYPDNSGDVDVDLRDAGGVFAVKLQERTGIGICTILTTSPGVSSEKQSGVGLQGYRLGVFANTATLNAYCTRLIWEAGAHTCPHDKAIMDRADFPQKHALATADALEAFAATRLGWTGKGGGTTTTTTTPKPTPTTTTTPAPVPAPAYPPKRVKGPDTVSHLGYPLTVNVKNRYLCIQGGHFKTAPSLDAPNGTPTPYKAGRKYTFDFQTTDEEWLFAKSGSWAPLKNFEPLV